MKIELTDEKEKIHPSVLTTREKLTVSRFLINKIAQIRLTVDNTIAGTAINTTTAIIINPTIKSSHKKPV